MESQSISRKRSKRLLGRKFGSWKATKIAGNRGEKKSHQLEQHSSTEKSIIAVPTHCGHTRLDKQSFPDQIIRSFPAGSMSKEALHDEVKLYNFSLVWEEMEFISPPFCLGWRDIQMLQKLFCSFANQTWLDKQNKCVPKAESNHTQTFTSQ